LFYGAVMKKTVLALTLILTLFSAALCTQLISLGDANPDWNYTGADWRYVTTITGTGDQETTVFVPNQAHTQIYGNCTSGSGTAQLGVFDDFGGSVYNYTSGGFHNFQGGTSFSSRRGPANVSVVIRTLNILNYTLVVEYDAAAPTTSTTPTPFPLPSLSPSQSPFPSPSQEPTPTPYTEPQRKNQEVTAGVAFATAVFAAGLGLLFYLIKRKD
jgi:hypothetical protein